MTSVPPDPYATGGEPVQPGAGQPPTQPPAQPQYGQYAAPQAPNPYPAQPAAEQYPSASPYPAAPQYPSAPQYPAAPYGGGYAPVYPKNNLAVWSLVLGILGFVACGILTSIPGIIVGKKAKDAAARGEANNGGMATAGYVISIVATALAGLGLILWIILIATGSWSFSSWESSSY